MAEQSLNWFAGAYMRRCEFVLRMGSRLWICPQDRRWSQKSTFADFGKSWIEPLPARCERAHSSGMAHSHVSSFRAGMVCKALTPGMGDLCNHTKRLRADSLKSWVYTKCTRARRRGGASRGNIDPSNALFLGKQYTSLASHSPVPQPD